jgi:hypothetical protein
MRVSLALAALLSLTSAAVRAQDDPVAAAAAVQAGWSEDTRRALACEDAAFWPGAELVTEPKQGGEGALRWAEHTTNNSISCQPFPADISAFNTLSFWLHSNVAKDATFMIVIESPREKGVFSYYSRKVTVDWTGWKRLSFHFRSFGRAREPAGWDKISVFRLTASGWDQSPENESVWIIDDMQLSYDPKPYLPEIRVKKYLEEPPVEAFSARLRPGHPRLILLDEDLPRIRAFVQEDPLGQAWYNSVKANAQRLYDRPVRHHELPDGRRLLSVSRDVLDRMYVWGLLYRLEGDRKWLDRAWQEMAAVVEFPDWNPNHYLDTAEMMHALAIGYDWFYNDLSEEQRATIRQGLWQHGLRLSYSAYMGIEAEGGQGWRGVENNWNFVCNGGSAIAAIALLDEMPEPCSKILHASFQYIQIPLHHFEPDGAWWEGMGYWGYSMRYLLSHLRAMETAFGTDFGLVEAMQGKGLSLAGDFPVYLTSPRNGFFNFADSGSGGSSYQHWGLFYLAARFRNPLYLKFQQENARGSVENILYYEPFAAEQATMALDKHFRGAEIATMRSSWDDPNALFVGIKGGKNGIAHAHQDLGSFAFYALGERWIQDLGTEGQTYQSHKHHLPGTDFYRIREEGHNTLVLNPGPGCSQGRRAEATVTRFEAKPDEALALLDLTEAYGEHVVSATRGYRLLAQRRAFLVQDELEPKGKADLWWFAHGAANTVMTLDETGRHAILERNGKLCHAYLLAPADAVFTVMDARPLPTSPDPEIQQQNRGISKLAVHLPETGKTTISVLFVPRFAHESVPDIQVAPVPLADWELGAAPSPRLERLAVNGESIPGFSPDVFAYTVELPAETVAPPTVTAEAPGQPPAIQPAGAFPGTTQVRLTDGATGGSSLYTVRFLPPPKAPAPASAGQKPSKPETVAGILVTASNDDGNKPGNVLDGNPATRWSASGEKEWIAFDFGQPRQIETIRIAWFSGHQRQTRFAVETSPDGNTWQAAFQGISSGKTDGFEDYSLNPPRPARHLRILGNGNTSNLWNSVSQVEFLPAEE